MKKKVKMKRRGKTSFRMRLAIKIGTNLVLCHFVNAGEDSEEHEAEIDHPKDEMGVALDFFFLQHS